MDKVQKIREEVERLQKELIQEKEKGFGSDIDDACILELQNVLTYIDSLQEEPKFKTGDRIKPVDSCLGSPRTIVDICNSWYVTDQGTLDFEYEDNWELVEHNHTDKNEPKFKVGDTIRLKNDGLEAKVTNIDESGFVYAACEDWKQIIDPSKWEIVHRTKTDVDEAMAEIERKAKLFTEANKGKTSEEILAEMRGEEPVSEELEKAADKYSETIESYYPNGMFDSGSIYSAFMAGANWQKAKDESTTEDLGEYINKLSKQFPEVSFAKLSRIAVRVAKWQREQMEKEYSNLNKGLATAKGLAVTMAYDKGMADAREQMMKNIWKPADGDDLPEYDRGTIVLTQPYPLKGSEFAVSFAHRPNPNGWDVKRIITGQVEHYTPKTYGKGGWNIPDIKYWLDVKFPK